MNKAQNNFLLRLQTEWDNHKDDYSEDGFKEYAVGKMEDYLEPDELDEVMGELDLSR